MKYILPVVIIFIISTFNYGQDKYLIYFKDKGIEPGSSLNKSSELYKQALDNLNKRAIERRKKNMRDEIITYEDLPINERYINIIESTGAQIIHKLTWFNAVSAYLNNEQLRKIKQFPFVEKVEPVRRFIRRRVENTEPPIQKVPGKTTDYNYGQSFGQLQLSDIPIVHSKGITGEGVIIGLLDSGFDWRDHESLVNADVIAEYDFVFNDTITADEPEDVPGQHNHGTSVMSEVAGFKDGTLIGASFNSSFLLAKTEYIPTETHVEEDNYAAALIWMENSGVYITSSSLGYSTFDPPEFSYTYNDMDGKTTIVTQACELAFRRGVVTITSAGNEGNSTWYYITAPADGFNTIAVGAVTSSNVLAGFSSHGPTSDGRIKPDIVTQGVGVYAAHASGFTNYTPTFGGTSAAAPLACGIAGLLLSAHPHLTNVQVREILLKTADNSSSPNNDRGYGLASAQRAINFPNMEFKNDSYTLHKMFINHININPSTVKLHYSVEGEPFQEVVMNFDGNLRYTYNFSDLTTNDFIEFYFVYEDMNGTSYREPETGNYGQIALDTEVVNNIPKDFSLEQNYPNPFNSQTKIRFTAPANETVELSVYNMLGEKIVELFRGSTTAGSKVVNWNGKDESGKSLSSGVYFYVLKSDNNFLSRKMILLK